MEKDGPGGVVPAPVWLVAGMACFGSATPVARIVGRDLPIALASGLRMAVALAVLLPVVALQAGRFGPALDVVRRGERGDRVRLLALGLIGTVAFSALMLAGMRLAPGTVAAVVMGTTPAVTAAGAALFLGDRIGPRTMAAIVLAVAGVVLVNLTSSSTGGDSIVVGSALVFAAVCCEATYTLVAKRMTREVDSLTLTLLAVVIAAVAFVPFALAAARSVDWSAPSAGEWLAVAWWGGGTLALGSWLWFKGLRQVSGGDAAPYMAVMPVSALVLSYVLLGEPFQFVQVVGLALVVLGIAIHTLSHVTGERVATLLDRLRSGYLFLPVCFAVAAVLAVVVLLAVDRRVQTLDLPLWTYGGGPQNASQVLTTIASSMITFTGVVFSILIVALQLTSSQFSPRALRNFLRDRTTQVALGVFVATFTYSFAALTAVRVAAGDADSFVPVVTITGALALVGASIIVFVLLIHHTAQSMRVVNIVERIAEETRSTLERQYPAVAVEPPPPLPHLGPPTVVAAPRAGVLADVDLSGLAELAARRETTVELHAPAGEYLCRGAPLLYVYGSDDERDWTDHLRLDVEPTMHDNAAFGIRQLVDIAERALSPGINDPTTAVQCLDRLHDLLRSVANRPVADRRWASVDGVPRACAPQPDFETLLSLSLDELEHWGRDSPQVSRRIDALVDDLLCVTVDSHRRAALLQHTSR